MEEQEQEPVEDIELTPEENDRFWEWMKQREPGDDLTRIKRINMMMAILPAEKEPGRNDPCSCGSGKKYKKCCGG